MECCERTTRHERDLSADAPKKKPAARVPSKAGMMCRNILRARGQAGGRAPDVGAGRNESLRVSAHTREAHDRTGEATTAFRFCATISAYTHM